MLVNNGLVYLIALPLFGSAFLLLVGRRADRWGHLLATALSGMSFILGAVQFYQMLGRSPENRAVSQKLFNWISVGSFNVDAGLLVDQLSICFVLLITGVGTLIHIYSIAYMDKDKDRRRFFAYLNLFIASMLLLVMGDSYLNLYVGWEGVGLASYLLIGFWNQKPAYATASKKAFIANRVGDMGLSFAIMIAFATMGTVSFSGVKEATEGTSQGALTAIGIMLLVAAAGKSAQFPLQAWLGDAMAGPTPVSALIHAATMVTAGVFLVARCSPLFEYSQYALNLVAFVGATTAIFAASIAIVQTDIKRIIAYSTCSQLGYMFFAAGMGAYNVAIFHLFTHAFFKALLFLGAGSVIHAFHDEQNIEKMGGVWKKIPLTYALMLIGTLALTGFPLLAGFYSKDAIIESAYFSKSLFAGYAFVIGLTTAFITSIYSWRLIFKTFHGKYNNTMSFEKVHESGPVMLIPLLLLAVGAIFSGYVFHGIFIGENTQFWGKAIFFLKQTAHEHPPLWLLILIPTLVISAIPLSFILFLKRKDIVEGFINNHKPFYNFLVKKWYFDELYNLIFVKSFRGIGTFLWQRGDVKTIDAYGPDGVAKVVKNLSDRASSVQSGYLYHYATVILIGVILIVSFLIII